MEFSKGGGLISILHTDIIRWSHCVMKAAELGICTLDPSYVRG